MNFRKVTRQFNMTYLLVGLGLGVLALPTFLTASGISLGRQRRGGVGRIQYTLPANPNWGSWTPTGNYSIGKMGQFYLTGRDITPFGIWPPHGRGWMGPFQRSF